MTLTENERLAVLETQMAQSLKKQHEISGDVKELKKFQNKTSAYVAVFVFIMAGLAGWVKVGLDWLK